MILAAGRGERLRPLTEQIPKAMCVVKGKPLIEHHVLHLAKAGFDRLIINHAYLGAKIRQHLGNGHHLGVDIQYSPEAPGGLETGGGIVNALPLIGNQPFITVNADIYTDFDFSLMRQNTSLMHLILVKNNPTLRHHGDFGLTKDNLVTNQGMDYTYAGIASYQPEVFSQSAHGRYSLTPLIRHCVAQNQVTGTAYGGIWFDIGSIERLEAANKSLS